MNLTEHNDIYRKKKTMGTAHKLKEYEDKLFKGLLKEDFIGNYQRMGDEHDLMRDMDQMGGGETQMDEYDTEEITKTGKTNN